MGAAEWVRSVLKILLAPFGPDKGCLVGPGKPVNTLKIAIALLLLLAETAEG